MDNPKKEFIDTILSFQSHDVWTVFSDFFAITALEFRCSLSSFEFKCGDLEQKKVAINQIYAKYQDKEKELFPKLYALLEMLIDAEIQNKRFTDIAGAIFHELDAGNKHTGQFFTPQHLADLTADLCKVGVRAYPHKFRHTTATMAIQKGMRVEQVQVMLGHNEIDTTMIYAKVASKDVKYAHAKYLG